jgi:predicted small integral membrane protein
MTVLLITALIVFVIVTYQIITKLDEVMEYKFNYRFFTKKSLGISTFIYILVKNVRNTDSIWGVLLTFTQAMVYLPLSALAIFVVIGMAVAYAQIRPVYIVE